MPRKNLLTFDSEKLNSLLSKAIIEVSKVIGEDIVKQIKANLSAITFKDNEVLTTQGTTSDFERQDALINSVMYDADRYVKDKIYNICVHAMRTNFEESHIGWYYEYGTGESEVPSLIKYKALEEANPFRTGKEIVSRSRTVNSGVWSDVGGNVRITRSTLGGGTSTAFRDYIGDDVEPHHWFARGIEESQDEIQRLLETKISQLDLTKCFKSHATYTLGVD